MSPRNSGRSSSCRDLPSPVKPDISRGYPAVHSRFHPTMRHLTADMAGMVVANLFYGIYFNLFLTSTHLICRRATANKSASVFRSAAFVSSLILFVFVTISCILLTVRGFQGFVFFDAGPEAFFAEDSHHISAVVDIFTLACVFLNDWIMIYRLYIVWNHSRPIIILPVLAGIGYTGCGVALIFDIKKLGSTGTIMSLTGFIFTLAYAALPPVRKNTDTLTNVNHRMNIYCTLGICWKIHTITRACLPEGGTNLRDLLAMLVESSALYTSWGLFYAITHQINDNSQIFAIATLPPVAGIANALLYTRVGMATSSERDTIQTSQALRFRTRTGQADLDVLDSEASVV
ncbi:hypothetical protein C8F04DRAFT_342867 [Mycena alexandri]|uniref:Uncharacterized protein n=1 Tax=Mycena alexandri TaxID=1745969 RepID=A0AAD6TLB0_9AGAR|nr:hypothetical protein C8F04DRAFT_342867 [Mycena alexandri]